MAILKRFSGLIIILIFFTLILAVNENPANHFDKCEVSTEEAKEIFSDARFLELQNDNCFYVVKNQKGEKRGEVISVKNDKEDFNGYGGKLRVIVGIDNKGKVAGIKMGRNYESASFLEAMQEEDFFDNWKGLSLEDALNKEVDAVTGATVSAKAVTEMVNKNISAYSGLEKSRAKKGGIPFLLIFLILVASYSLFSFFFPQKTAPFRKLHLIALVTLFGFTAGESISMEALRNMLVNRHFATFTVAIFILSSLLSLIKKKNFYCYELCPFGAAQELVGALPIKKKTIPVKVINYAEILRKLILYTFFILMFFNIGSDFSLFEPFSAFQFKSSSTASLVIALFFLIFSLFVHRPWCRLVCPTGKMFDTIKTDINSNHKS
ncbi:MAG: FMN-binding protein [bacterium]